MPLLEVGKPYLPGRTRLEPRAEYNWRAGQHELLLCLSDLTEAEVQAIAQGEAEFALLVWRDVIFLLFRFGDAIGWSDAPYSWHLVAPGERTLPPVELSAKARAVLAVILVDADRNVVRALRLVTFSPELTGALHGAIRAQAARPFDAAAYDAQLAEAYERWKTSEAMVAKATIRWRGGE
jgi:hypothetical protein